MDEVLSQLGLALFCFVLWFICGLIAEKWNENKFNNINQIKKGMTDNEVKKLLGIPDSSSNGDIKEFTYRFSGCGRNVNVHILFNNNWEVVHSYSCEHNSIY